MQEIGLSQDQIKEIVHCMKDPVYFIENFCWLQEKASAGVSQSSGVIPFTMGQQQGEAHFFQRNIIHSLYKRKNVLSLKSRRVGCSWIAAAYAAWLINFHENVNVLFISQNGLKAKQILDKVKFILNNLAYHDSENARKATKADWLRGEIIVNNQERLSIGWRNDDGSIRGNSDVLSLNNTDNAGRGDDATFIVFDELAFYEHPDQTWASAITTLARGGHWMSISTPNGIGDIFHRLCSKGDLAEMGKLDEELNFEYYKIHYSDAGITDEQVTKSTEGMPQDLIDQEWEFLFIAPGTVAFDPTHLAACYKPPSEYPEIAAALEEYREKVMSGKGEKMYYSGGDTSEAKVHRKKSKKDYHSFIPITDSGIQAGAYHSKESLSKWAGKVLDDGTGERVEVLGTLSKLHEEYPGVLYAEAEGVGLVPVNQHKLPDDTFSELVPVGMKHFFKRGIVEKFILKVEHHQVTITDLFTYQCLSVFLSLGGGKYGAATGYFDDPVIAILLASAALDAHGVVDMAWATRLRDVKREDNIPTPEEHLFATGPMVDLKTPDQTARVSEQIAGGGGLDSPMSDYEALRWIADQDEEDFNRVRNYE